MKISKYFTNSIVEYDPDTGSFIWTWCHRKPWMIDKPATHFAGHGHLYIKADGRNHSASRLAWELIHGMTIPRHLEIDHINRARYDNRIDNLRIVTRKMNLKNAERIPGVSGVLGISIYRRPSGNGYLWRARKGETVRYFPTLGEAIAGYAQLVAEQCPK